MLTASDLSMWEWGGVIAETTSHVLLGRVYIHWEGSSIYLASGSIWKFIHLSNLSDFCSNKIRSDLPECKVGRID